MAVRANWKITTTDKEGKVIEYQAGDIIKNLDEKEETRLIRQGAVERVTVISDEENINEQEENMPIYDDSRQEAVNEAKDTADPQDHANNGEEDNKEVATTTDTVNKKSKSK